MKKSMFNSSGYSFEDFRKEISEGRNEMMFRCRGVTYSIGIHGEETFKSVLKKRGETPFWEFVDETNKKVLLIEYKEKIIDKIRVDGKKLETIYSEIEFI